MKLRNWILSLLSFCFVLHPLQAATFCVSSAVSLQNSLDTAASNGSEDTIKIESGTYVGNFSYVSSEEKGLRIEGGYNAGCVSTIFDQALSVLDGDDAGTVLILVDQGHADYTLKGFTVKSGNNIVGSTTYSSTNGNGGGMYVRTLGHLDVDQLKLVNNRTYGRGGGLYFIGEATIKNSSFVNNDANHSSFFSANSGHHGGGLHIVGPATVTGNDFNSNSSGDKGGGAYIQSSSSGGTPPGVIKDNTFSKNRASEGGGALYAAWAIIESNIFSGNEGGYDQFCASGCTGVAGSSSTIQGHRIDIIKNVISNSPTPLPVINHTVSSANRISGNVISGNAGAAIQANNRLYDGIIYYSNNLIIDNQSGLSIEQATGSLYIYNNVFLNNSFFDMSIDNVPPGSFFPIDVYLYNNSYDPAKFTIDASPTVDDLSVFITDAKFVNAALGDYHLKSDSLLIDAGNQNDPFKLDTDLDGSPRIVGASIDLGPYEYQEGGVPPVMPPVTPPVTPPDNLPNKPINKEILVTIGRPKEGDKLTGTVTVTGWAVSPSGISSMELYVDDELYSAIPQGGARPDVNLAFPSYPGALSSGFALTYPASGLTAGVHVFSIYAFDNQGNMNFVSANVTIDKFDNGWASKSEVSLDGATLRKQDNSIFVDNVKMKGVPHDIKMEWDQTTQQWLIIEIE